MKKIKYKYLTIGVLLLSSILFLTFYSFQFGVGPHGGVVKKVDNYNIEVKAPYPAIYAFLLDKNLKPINNKGLFCEIRFFPPDDIPIDVNLQPYEGDGFKIESSAIAYGTFRVTFHVSGKSVSAMFYNENAIVLKK